ncbi:MAG: hypothetical protein OHK0013_01600 [Sandaracinaceae bacterium]
MGRSNAKTKKQRTNPPKPSRSLVLVGMAGIRRNEIGDDERPLLRAATTLVEGRLAQELVVVVDPTKPAPKPKTRGRATSDDEPPAPPTSDQIARTLVRDVRAARPERFGVSTACVPAAKSPAGVHDPEDVRQRFESHGLVRSDLDREGPPGSERKGLFERLSSRRASLEVGVCIDSGTPAQWGALAAMAEERGFCASLVSVRGPEVRTYPITSTHRADDDLDALRSCPEALVERYGRARTGCVLITGPTGTGKSQLAHGLHQAWRKLGRRKDTFVPVSCAAIPENLLESELFGHKKGAFTGATAEKKGAFLSADGGTLFLDEVGELPLHLQAKLLVALDNPRTATGENVSKVRRVGSDEPEKTDVRVVLATNRDLEAAVRAGTFRDDLLARISTHAITLAPLRERPHRIVIAYLQRLHDEGRRYGVELVLGRDGLAVLLDLAYDPASAWSWNYRDVTQSAERLAFEALSATGRATSASVVLGATVVEREAKRLRTAWAFRGSPSRESSPWHELEEALEPGALASMAELTRWKALYLWRAWRASGGVKAAAWRWLVDEGLMEPVGRNTDAGKTFDGHWNDIARWRRPLPA